MRCSILAVGSRGDVHPLIALGAGLRNAGLSVTVATHRDYETEVAQQGFTFHQLDGSATRFLNGAAGNAFRERVRDPKRFKQFFDNYLSLFYQRLLRESWAAARDADVVISWAACAPSLAERLSVPVFVGCPYPPSHLPTWSYPNPYQGPYRYRLGPLFNRWTWRAADELTQLGTPVLNQWRRELLGLNETDWRKELRRLRRQPHLLGFSPAILPRPSGWSRSIHVTGPWTIDASADYEPSPALNHFLQSGPPPIAVGFSSQVARQPGTLAKLVMDAATQADQRVILISGFSGFKLADVPAHVFPMATIPYDWMLPRVSALVHQGGAGSTALACRHGVPNFAVPFGFDQSLWGERLHELGVGPRPINARDLSVDRLAAAFRELASTPGFRARAQAVAEAMRHEDGVKHATTVVLSAIGR